jgi:SAM-dependent methyltransferase
MALRETYESTGCIICGASDPAPVYSGKGQFGLRTNVCVCRRCGFSFLNPRWDERTYFAFYETGYDKYYRDKPVTAPAEKNLSSYYPIYVRYTGLFSTFEPRSVLDVGSGNGELLSYLMQQNPAAEYYAIEPSLSGKAGLESRGIRFISNDVNSDWEQDHKGKFDLVIMRHVLEHFLDPVAVLKKIREAMTDAGVLYIAVPDAYNYAPPLRTSFFRVVHPYYFTKDSLLNLLQLAGFSPVTVVEAGKANNFQEMYAFAAKSDAQAAPEISTDNYLKQKQIYEAGLKKEDTLSYKAATGLKQLFYFVVRIKKFFFPKPVL